MATCWSCGSTVSDFCYNCPSCESLGALTELKEEALANGQGIDRLAAIQLAGFQKLQATLSQGLSQIATAMEWGFAEVSWQLQQQTDVLKGIDETLKTPAETQANEFRQMAEKLVRRGVLDEAEEFYRKSLELNRLDYRTYIGLAGTLLRQNDFEEALKVLHRSLPHAPTSKGEAIDDWRSYSLRLIGHVHACLADYGEAEAALSEAVQLSPRYAECLYDLAQVSAQVGRVRQCIESMRAAVEIEPLYWYLCQRQRAFVPVQKPLKQLLVEMREAAAEVATRSLDKVDRAWRTTHRDMQGVGASKPNLFWLLGPTVATTRLHNLFGSIERINKTITQLQKDCQSSDYAAVQKAVTTAKGLQQEVQEIAKEVDQLLVADEEERKGRNVYLSMIGFVLLFLVFIVYLALTPK